MKTRLVSKLAGGLGPLLALVLIVALAVPVPALAAPPAPPCWFYGTVRIGDISAEPGTDVTARIDGVEVEWTTTVDELGRYGYGVDVGGTGVFYVESDDPETSEKDGGVPDDIVKFYVLDKLAGQAEFESLKSKELDLTVTIPDTTAPTVTITPLTPDPTNINTPTFTGTATDTESNIDSVEYSVDDGAWITADAVDGTFDSLIEEYTFTITVELDDEAHTVYVRATDAEMNTSTEPYASDEFVVDTTPPTVSTTPEDGATVTIEVVVSATFDEAIDEATLVFTLDSVAGSVAGAPSYDGVTKTATFIPEATLDHDITYTASVQASDLVGNAMEEAHIWSFTTVINNPPTVSEPSPADQAINVSTSPELSVLTSDLDGDLMTVTFYDASDDSVIGTVEEAASGTRPSVVWAGLDYEVQYSWYVKVSDAINPEVTSDTWTFTTEAAVDATPPYTSGHDPAKGATSAIDTNIVVHVLDDGDGVDIGTIAMTVEGASVTPVITGTPADYTLTYDPPTDFAYLQVVDVTVDASDLADNAMDTDSYSFTTTEAEVLMGIQLVAGWNTFSTPIALDSCCDTWGKFRTISGILQDPEEIAYYFDSSQDTPWIQVTDVDSLEPLDGFYVYLLSEGTANIIPNPEITSPPTRVLLSGLGEETLYLVGLASLDDMDVHIALGTWLHEVADGLPGYGGVISPRMNAPDDWGYSRYYQDPTYVYVPEDYMIRVGTAVWVAMLNDGTLVGWTETPIP